MDNISIYSWQSVNYTIERMCRVLKVSRSSYYRWLKGGISNRKKENKQLTDQIKEVFEVSKHTYGSPRITHALRRNGCRVSRPRVAKLMKQAGLTSKVKRKYRVTTDSNHSYPIVQNHLNRNFTPSAPNQSWVYNMLLMSLECWSIAIHWLNKVWAEKQIARIMQWPKVSLKP